MLLGGEVHSLSALSKLPEYEGKTGYEVMMKQKIKYVIVSKPSLNNKSLLEMHLKPTLSHKDDLYLIDYHVILRAYFSFCPLSESDMCRLALDKHEYFRKLGRICNI